MVINYLDSNMIVEYLQVYLKERSGLLLSDDLSSITSNKELKVTKYFDIDTYIALSIFMAFNYPKEGFPVKYMIDKQDPKKYVTTPYEGETSAGYRNLISILNNNINLSYSRPEVINTYSPRILSYIFEEVVNENSHPDEILRIQKLLYPNGIYKSRIGVYDAQMIEDVLKIQKDAVDYVENSKSKEDSYKQLVEEVYRDIKCTGYVDPWTEVLIKVSQ